MLTLDWLMMLVCAADLNSSSKVCAITFFMFASSSFKSLSSVLYPLIASWLAVYSLTRECFSIWTCSSCSVNFRASDSNSRLSWMCYCNSLLISSQSFSAICFSCSSFLFNLRRLLSSCYSYWCFSLSSSFATLVAINFCLSSSCSLSALVRSSMASSSCLWYLMASCLKVFTWLDTSTSYVLDLLSLTANSLSIFSDIYQISITPQITTNCEIHELEFLGFVIVL